jgi:hypothetical protein
MSGKVHRFTTPRECSMNFDRSEDRNVPFSSKGLDRNIILGTIPHFREMLFSYMLTAD